MEICSGVRAGATQLLPCAGRPLVGSPGAFFPMRAFGATPANAALKRRDLRIPRGSISLKLLIFRSFGHTNRRQLHMRNTPLRNAKATLASIAISHQPIESYAAR
jgi:hypothetical protein